MSSLHFLDLPLSIRHQIYAELLVPSFTKDSEERYAYKEATTSILYVNRQIYAESSAIFYARNLFVVICSNSSQAFSGLTPEKTPIFARVKNRSSITQCPRFALSVELRSIKTLSLVQSTSPAYVITSEALPLFFPALVGPTEYPDNRNFGNFTTTGAIALFQTLTFGRLAALTNYPCFSALRIQSNSIAPAHRSAMMRWCDTSRWPFDSVYWPFAIDRLIGSLHLDETFNMLMDSPRKPCSEGEIGAVFDQLLETIDIYWECSGDRFQSQLHLEQYCYGEEDSAATTRRLYSKLYSNVLNLCNTLVREVFAIAKRHPYRANACYTEARRIAESGIQYLNRDERAMGWLPYHSQRDGKKVGVIDQDQGHRWHNDCEEENEFSEANTMLSLKAARVCKKLGDFIAAKEYLEDARASCHLSGIVAEQEESLRDAITLYENGVWRGKEPLKTTEAVLWKRRKVAVESSGMIDSSYRLYHISLMILERRGQLAQLWARTPL
ncbi:hypothetical protein DM02DRAFT_734036 [Periconia macrospinosa]|uniref:Uncharacterized protein n=1 Tax=Periconia macrospinosa TaxID=97972 RepID=A0A2V1D2E2_9PLEO|nr:hypothetical protein DM02DRAFT_734036 [Periconia macrospinosa]